MGFILREKCLRIKKLLVKCRFASITLIQIFTGIITTKKYFRSKQKRAFLLGTPEHDNLGDHAIALAELQFLERYFPEYKIVEISVESWHRYRINLLTKTNKEDIFFLTGGGNMGNIYFLDERLRRFIISHFKTNKIVIFPQTIYFTDDKAGQKELKKTQDIYNSHAKLLLCAREKKSFSLMKTYFGEDRVFLCPDMVFSLMVSFEKKIDPNLIGICLRSDIEGTLSSDMKNSIIKIASQNHSIKIFNTCLPYGISKSSRKQKIEMLLEDIAQNSVVITDRLHGAIFSIITNTPCIAYANLSHKIKFTKEWICDNNIFSLITSTDDLAETIEFVKESAKPFDIGKFKCYFIEMAKRIKDM